MKSIISILGVLAKHIISLEIQAFIIILISFNYSIETQNSNKTLLILPGQNLVPKPTCQSQTPSRGRNREDQNVCHRGRPASTSLRPRGPTSPTPVLPTRPRGPPSPSASIQRAPGQAPGDGRPFYADPHAPGIATFSGG